MENKISHLKNCFETSITRAKEKGEEYVTTQIFLEDMHIIAEALKHEMQLGEKCVAVESKTTAVRSKATDVGDRELADTVEAMTSPDYKERFKAEYRQTKIRYERLKKFNTRIEAAIATNYSKNAVEMPKHDCPDEMLREQQKMMGNYLRILEVRAVIEGIDL